MRITLHLTYVVSAACGVQPAAQPLLLIYCICFVEFSAFFFPLFMESFLQFFVSKIFRFFVIFFARHCWIIVLFAFVIIMLVISVVRHSMLLVYNFILRMHNCILPCCQHFASPLAVCVFFFNFNYSLDFVAVFGKLFSSANLCLSSLQCCCWGRLLLLLLWQLCYVASSASFAPRCATAAATQCRSYQHAAKLTRQHVCVYVCLFMRFFLCSLVRLRFLPILALFTKHFLFVLLLRCQPPFIHALSRTKA